MEGPRSGQRQLRFGLYEVNLATGELFKRGVQIRLENHPFRILSLLVERPGEVVTRKELQEKLWPADTFVEFDNGLNTAMGKLRYALSDSAENPRFIETIPRRGYRFIAPVSSPVSGDATIAVLTPASTFWGWHADRSKTLSSSVEGAAASQPPRDWKLFGVLLLVMVVAAIISYGLQRWGFRRYSPNFERLRFTKLTSSGKAEDVAISPDGNYLVYSQRDRNGLGLWLRHVSSGSDVQILPSEEIDLRGLTFSPDGNSIYFVRTRKDTGSFKDLYAIPILGGASRLLTRDIDSPVSFSPEGRQFVYTRGISSPEGNEIRVANADGSADRPLATIAGTSGNFQAGAAWSPDGQTIAVSLMLRGNRPGYVLNSLSVRDGKVREVLWNAGVIGRPLWLPEGDKVLVDVDDPTGRGQLWTITFPQGERRRVTNDLANWGIRIDATRDARKVAAIQWSLSADIWDDEVATPLKAKKITSGEMPFVAAVPGTSGNVLGVSADGRLWIINSDSTERHPFSNLQDVAPPVMCGHFAVLTSYASAPSEDSRADAGTLNATKLASGRFVVQRSYQSGVAHIVRIDADGLNATTLASGLVYSPTCSSDGKFLFYVSMESPQSILRLPIEGGEPTVVSKIPGSTIRGTMRASPDGQFLAFPYDVNVPRPGIKLAVISVNRRLVDKILDAPPGIYRESCLRWSPDGKGVQYLLTKGDVTNIWEQPLAGSSPKQVTNFTSGRIFDFNWSHDGKQLFLSRGEISSDVVLLSNLR